MLNDEGGMGMMRWSSEMGFNNRERSSSTNNSGYSPQLQIVCDDDLKPLNNHTQALEMCSDNNNNNNNKVLITEDGQGSASLHYPPLFSLHTPLPLPNYNNLWAWAASGDAKEFQLQGVGGTSTSSYFAAGGSVVEDYSSYSLIGGRGRGRGISVSLSAMKKIKGRRKVREPRFSFKTMTDVDVLDDGYKWRKYGQKVVKNTLHPRSYYRCTQEKCRVKKRVERLAEDPRMVITTYEGRHVHSPSNDVDDSQTPQPHLNNFFW